MHPDEPIRVITIAISNAIMQLIPKGMKFHLAVFDEHCEQMVSATNSSCEHCIVQLISEYSKDSRCISDDLIDLPKEKIN